MELKAVHERCSGCRACELACALANFREMNPATGGYADSNMGGHFGPALKYAGYDVLLLNGRAPQPSYLFIEDDTVELRLAEAWWGQGALTTEAALQKVLGDEFKIITIGPAGENRVRFACISHDFGRQAGRTAFISRPRIWAIQGINTWMQ